MKSFNISFSSLILFPRHNIIAFTILRFKYDNITVKYKNLCSPYYDWFNWMLVESKIQYFITFNKTTLTAARLGNSPLLAYVKNLNTNTAVAMHCALGRTNAREQNFYYTSIKILTCQKGTENLRKQYVVERAIKGRRRHWGCCCNLRYSSSWSRGLSSRDFWRHGGAGTARERKLCSRQ